MGARCWSGECVLAGAESSGWALTNERRRLVWRLGPEQEPVGGIAWRRHAKRERRDAAASAARGEESARCGEKSDKAAQQSGRRHAKSESGRWHQRALSNSTGDREDSVCRLATTERGHRTHAATPPATNSSGSRGEEEKRRRGWRRGEGRSWAGTGARECAGRRRRLGGVRRWSGVQHPNGFLLWRSLRRVKMDAPMVATTWRRPAPRARADATRAAAAATEKQRARRAMGSGAAV